MLEEPILARTKTLVEQVPKKGLEHYYKQKIEEMEVRIIDKRQNLRRLEAQRNEMNLLVKNLMEELDELLKPSSQVAEVVKVMSKGKCLVKSGNEGKMVVLVEPNIDLALLIPNARVALRYGSSNLYKVLPTMIDPLVSLMKVEKVPDSTYDMIGGLD